MSYTEYIDEFKNAQKNKIGPYYMFFVDMKNSLHQLRFEDIRVKFVKFLVKLKEFCELKNTEYFNTWYGNKQGYYMRVGDGVAIVIDIRKENINNFRKEWKDFYQGHGLEFHNAECYVEDLTGHHTIGSLYYGYAFPFLEDSLKKDIKLGEDHFFESIGRRSMGIFLEIPLSETMKKLGLDDQKW